MFNKESMVDDQWTQSRCEGLWASGDNCATRLFSAKCQMSNSWISDGSIQRRWSSFPPGIVRISFFEGDWVGGGPSMMRDVKEKPELDSKVVKRGFAQDICSREKRHQYRSGLNSEYSMGKWPVWIYSQVSSRIGEGRAVGGKLLRGIMGAGGFWLN